MSLALALLWACALAGGCTSSPRNEGSWAYVGTGNALRSPPFTNERRRDEEMREDFAAWQQSRVAAVQTAK